MGASLYARSQSMCCCLGCVIVPVESVALHWKTLWGLRKDAGSSEFDLTFFIFLWTFQPNKFKLRVGLSQADCRVTGLLLRLNICLDLTLIVANVIFSFCSSFSFNSCSCCSRVFFFSCAQRESRFHHLPAPKCSSASFHPLIGESAPPPRT